MLTNTYALNTEIITTSTHSFRNGNTCSECIILVVPYTLVYPITQRLPKKFEKKIVYPCIKLIGVGGVDLFKNRF